MESTILLNKKRDLTFAFFALIYGIVLLFILTSEAVAAFDDLNGWLAFYYFTNQSNFFVCVWLLCYGITRFRGTNTKFGCFITSRVVIIALTTYITITFLVVAFILTPIYQGTFFWGISGSMAFTHLLTPVVMWIYFFFIPGEGNLKYRSAWISLSYPLLYMVANLIIGATVKYQEYEWISHIDPVTQEELWTQIVIQGGNAYAYDFINPHWYPNILVFILAIIGLSGVFGLLGMGFVKLKKYLIKNFYVNE